MLDLEVLKWRAISSDRLWFPVAVFGAAWSMGVGLALLTMTHLPSDCKPNGIGPLIASPVDILTLPVRALVGLPYGVMESGMMFVLAITPFVFVIVAVLTRGALRRVLSPGVLCLAAFSIGFAGWTTEVAVAFSAGTLPPSVCTT